MNRFILTISIILLAANGLFAQIEDIDPDYLNTLHSRAGKIVESLELNDCKQAERARDIIVIQYYELSKIHDFRDAEKENLHKANTMLYKLHASYIAALSSELTLEQVDQVKDGMTYGVLEHTYKAYMDLLPDLSDEQKRYIYKNLVEAREFAIDAGSSKEKHGWFGKYKGRINNYLSKAGYDLKQAENERKENKNSGK